MNGFDDREARATILSLLASRALGSTICPSEVARALAGGADTQWRDAMLMVHAAVDGLLLGEVVQLSWKGKPLVSRSGPYRIAIAAKNSS